MNKHSHASAHHMPLMILDQNVWTVLFHSNGKLQLNHAYLKNQILVDQLRPHTAPLIVLQTISGTSIITNAFVHQTYHLMMELNVSLAYCLNIGITTN